jgi:tetratricopeptide (TPR) repeat protein
VGDAPVSLALLQELRVLVKQRRYEQVEVIVSALPRIDLLKEPELGFHLATAWLYSRQSAKALTLTEELLDATLKAGNDHLHRRVHLLRSAFFSRQGKLNDAEVAIGYAMEDMRWNEPSSFVAEANNSLGVVLSMRGDWEGAVAQLNRAMTLFKQIGLRRGIGMVNHNLALTLRYWGRYAEAERFFIQANAYFIEEGIAQERAYCEAERSLAMLGLGDLRLAQSMARRSLERCRELGSRELLGESLRIMGIILRESGEIAEAESILREAFGHARALKNLQLQAELHEELALLCGVLGQEGKTRGHAERARRHYARIGAWGYENRLEERLEAVLSATV